MRLSLALFASLALAASSCGPGDALFRAFVSVGKINIDLPRNNGLSSLSPIDCDLLRRENLQIDIGLMKLGESGMQSVPRHLVILPDQDGWLFDVLQDAANISSVRIRGSRPQELQFQPGSYLLAITGAAKCQDANGAPQIFPLVYYSSGEKPFTPGSEINLVVNAKFEVNPLGCVTASRLVKGFNYLQLNAASGTTAALISPTAPSLSTNSIDCTGISSIGYVGPVPAMGRYVLRLTSNTAATPSCYLYEGTSANPLGTDTPLTGAAIPCPAP